MDNCTLIMIIVLIAIIILYLIHTYNKNKLEHFELSTESVRNLTNTCKQEDILYNVGNFNNLTATNINTNNIISTKNGNLENIMVANLDVSNNFTGKQGKFDIVRSINLYGDVSANTGTITILNATNFNQDKLQIKNANVNKLCFTPTNCITKDMISSMILLDSPMFSYMYLPNTPSQTYNFILPAFDLPTPANATPATITATENNNIYDISQNYIKLKNTYANFSNVDPIIVPVGSGMTIKLDGTWGTPLKRVIRSDNTVTATSTQSGANPQDNGNGLKIKVPPKNNTMTTDFSVLWVQVTNKITSATPDSWQYFRVYDLLGTTTNVRKYFGKYIGGGNRLNNIDPNGATQSDEYDLFEWIPVPIDLNGNQKREIYISNFYSKDTWFSGFAFSVNPWNHAKSSALAIHWQVNKQDTSQGVGSIETDNTKIAWNNNVDSNNPQYNIQLSRFKANVSAEFRLPFVNSQRNKIFYIAVWNNEYNPAIVGLEISKNNVYQPLGNFYTTFDNPFSRHINSKTNLRYIGVIIPKDHLPPVTENFIKLKIITAPGIDTIFAEVGTHDENPFD